MPFCMEAPVTLVIPQDEIAFILEEHLIRPGDRMQWDLLPSPLQPGFYPGWISGHDDNVEHLA